LRDRGERVLGTPSYMSPEQVRAELVELRCVLYEIMTL
jgi:hypothetical protein